MNWSNGLKKAWRTGMTLGEGKTPDPETGNPVEKEKLIEDYKKKVADRVAHWSTKNRKSFEDVLHLFDDFKAVEKMDRWEKVTKYGDTSSGVHNATGRINRKDLKTVFEAVYIKSTEPDYLYEHFEHPEYTYGINVNVHHKDIRVYCIRVFTTPSGTTIIGGFDGTSFYTMSDDKTMDNYRNNIVDVLNFIENGDEANVIEERITGDKVGIIRARVLTNDASPDFRELYGSLKSL